MRIAVDYDLCQGHGVCESEAPAVFTVPKTGRVTLRHETPPDDERERVETAVRYCPTHALTIVED